MGQLDADKARGYHSGMPATVVLPSFFNIGSTNSFVRQVVGPNGYPASDSFIFDFQYLKFVDGAGLTVFYNALQWLLLLKTPVAFDNYAQYNPGTRYLDDCGFFEAYLGRKNWPQSSCRDSTLPCRMVQYHDAHQWLEFTFSPFVANHLGVSIKGLSTIRAGIKELFNNIKDHSNVLSGHIHVQYYPAKRVVGITVSDFGAGIPNTMRSRYPQMTDETAILNATMLGVTSKSIATNQGVGLDFLVQTVTGNGGIVGIYSFHGQVSCWGDASGINRRSYVSSAAYPGTLIDISLKVDQFVGDVGETGDASW